jgi:hypothetical protein
MVANAKRLMLFGEINDAHSADFMKSSNTFYEQDAEFSMLQQLVHLTIAF